MTEHLFGPERKPWDPPADDRLMPSSYEAIAVFSIAEMAYKQVHDLGLEPHPGTIAQYAKLFARVLVAAQTELGPGGWGSSLNARLRGALHTAMEINPLTPSTLSNQETIEESLHEWEVQTRETVIRIAKTAAWLHRLKGNLS